MCECNIAQAKLPHASLSQGNCLLCVKTSYTVYSLGSSESKTKLQDPIGDTCAETEAMVYIFLQLLPSPSSLVGTIFKKIQMLKAGGRGEGGERERHTTTTT